MPSLALLAAALLAAAPPVPGGPGTGDVSVEAGSGTYDATLGRYRFEDGVVLRRGAAVLRARSALYDPESGEVVATGDVLLTDAGRVLAADGVRAVLNGPFEAQGVVAFFKDGPLDLSKAATLGAARATGRNRLTLTGDRVQGEEGGRHLDVDGARLTLCDCDASAPPSDGAPAECGSPASPASRRPPSWELRARHADVIPGERAILSWPVLHITPRFLFMRRPIPVLVLPWLYLPLGDRQTGLLLPEIVSTNATGWAIAQPLFVTLGRSWDLTLTPTYAFGRTGADAAAGDVRGPILRSELRWAPAEGTLGRAELTWLDDLAKEPNGASGGRYSLLLGHTQRLGDATSLRVNLSLYGDPVLARDFTSDILARGASYRRSDVLLDRRSDALVLEAGAQYLEPLRPGGEIPGERFGLFGSAIDVLHRWPFGNAVLLPTGLGPFRLEAQAGVARFASGGALEGGEVTGAALGSTSLSPFTAPFAPLLPVRPAGVDLEFRRPVTRGDLRAELGLPLLLGDALALEPFVRGAALGYAFDTGGDPAARAWGVAGARVSTELSRAFGDLRHRITPSVEWRLGTGATGSSVGDYDGLDRAGGPVVATTVVDPTTLQAVTKPEAQPLLSAAPAGRFHQLRAALRNRLTLGAVDMLDLEVGQDVDLERGRAAETFFAGVLRAGPLTLDGSGRALAFASREEPVVFPVLPFGRVPPSRLLDRFTELRGTATLADKRGDALHVGILSVGAGASGALVAGLDPLFDPRSAPIDAVAQGNAGVRAVLGPATLAYDVLFPGRTVDFPTCDGTGVRRLGAVHVQQQVATFVWTSPCKCFRLMAQVGLNDCGAVTPKATIEFPGFGSSGRVSP